MNEEKYIVHGPELSENLSKDSIGKQVFEKLKEYKLLPVFMIDATSNQELSYQTLLEQSCRLADCLKNYGIVRNDVIAVCSENSLDYLRPVLAALYLGAIVTTFNPSYTDREILHVGNISKPKVIFCSKAVVKTLLKATPKMGYLRKIIVNTYEALPSSKDYDTLKQFMLNNSSKNFDVNAFEPIDLNTREQIAFILYSSGTTGLPKGVMLTHNNVNAVLSVVKDRRYIPPTVPGEEVTLGLIPFFHAYGLYATIVNLIVGRTVVLLKKFDEKVFFKTIQDYKISVLSLVPPLANLIARSPLSNKYDLSSVIIASCGAAPLNKKTEELLRKRLSNLKVFRQAYGMTELTLGVLAFPLGQNRPGSCGKVLPGVSVKIVDPETAKALGPNQSGEICVKGVHVMKGYAGDPESTSQTIDKDGWLSTGDVGYYDEEGFYYIVDRMKELIKYRGYQVAPAELEALLLTHPKIMDAAVVGLPNEEAGELPLAFVVLHSGERLTEQEVQTFVKKHISPQKWLRGGVRFVKEIPKNQTGKILRRKLRELITSTKSKL